MLVVQSIFDMIIPGYIWIITGIAIFLDFVKYVINVGIEFNNKN